MAGGYAAVAVTAASSGSALALLICLLVACKQPAERELEVDDGEERRSRGRRAEPWPDFPPETIFAAVALALRTVVFLWGETLGKWSIPDIIYLKRQIKTQPQADLQREYTGSTSVELKDDKALFEELNDMLKYLKLCMAFSQEKFSSFLQSGGFRRENVLIHTSKARLLKPAFTLMCDEKCKCFVIILGGAVSTTDRVTASAAAEVPFHHIVMHEGCISKVVLGHAHCGMVAAARWIASSVIPCLQNAMRQHPEFAIKIIGNSLGAGVGSLLTYILRERQEFSNCTCIAYAPAACMTWELAESGKGCITSLVNRTDVVPSFSRVSAANLHSEVILSSRLRDEGSCLSRFYKVINQQRACIQSCLPFMSCARDNHDIVESSMSEPLLNNVSYYTKVVPNGHWSYHNHSNMCTIEYPSATTSHGSTKALQNGEVNHIQTINHLNVPSWSWSAGVNEDGRQVLGSEGRLGLHNSVQLDSSLRSEQPLNDTRGSDTHMPRQLFPAGRIVHMVVLRSSEADNGCANPNKDEVRVYETSRELYSKIRLGPLMIEEHYLPSYKKTLEDLTTKLQSILEETVDV